MLFLMSLALMFVFVGGQIAVMVTDFLQGGFANFVFLAVIFFLMCTMPWEHMADTLLGNVWEGQVRAGPEGKSMIDPFDLGKEERFGTYECDQLRWISSTEIRCVVPAGIGVDVKEYGRKEKIQDAVACAVLSGVFFVVIWIAFGLDVLTTGM